MTYNTKDTRRQQLQELGNKAGWEYNAGMSYLDDRATCEELDLDIAADPFFGTGFIVYNKAYGSAKGDTPGEAVENWADAVKKVEKQKQEAREKVVKVARATPLDALRNAEGWEDIKCPPFVGAKADTEVNKEAHPNASGRGTVQVHKSVASSTKAFTGYFNVKTTATGDTVSAVLSALTQAFEQQYDELETAVETYFNENS